MGSKNNNTGDKAPSISDSRIGWIDVARCFAIMTVILCHVSESVYFYSGIDIAKRSALSQTVGFSLFTIGRLGVPIFLFISGYLLLDRKYDGSACVRFWKNNFLRLLVVTQIWIIIYNIFLSVFQASDIVFSDVIKELLFLKNVDMPHMWYLPMILGIYITIPFVAIVYENIEKKFLYFPMAIAVIYCFGVPSINVILSAVNQPAINNQLFLYFSGGVYGLYLTVGYFFKKGFLSETKRGIHLFVLIAAFAGMIGFQIYCLRLGSAYKVWYDFILLPFAASAVFALIKGSNIYRKCPRVWNQLSTCSFGIYLIHKPIQSILMKLLDFHSVNTPIRILILWLLVFILSWGIVTAVSRISKIGKWLFMVK